MFWRPAGARVYEHWSDRMNQRRTNVVFKGAITEGIFDAHFGIAHFASWQYDNDNDARRW